MSSGPGHCQLIWGIGRAQGLYVVVGGLCSAALSCVSVLQLYQEAGVVAEGFTGVPVFQVRLRLQQCSMSARQ